MEPFAMAEEEGQFDLSLHIAEEPSDLTAVFKFNTGLFAGDSIGRMAQGFLTLLENIAAEPSKGIDEIALLSAQERERLLEMWRLHPEGLVDLVSPEIQGGADDGAGRVELNDPTGDFIAEFFFASAEAADEAVDYALRRLNPGIPQKPLQRQ